MKKYRFKTIDEFKEDNLWLEDFYSSSHDGYPEEWCEEGSMNTYLGEEIPSKFNKHIEQGHGFDMDGWTFRIDDVTEVIEPEISIEEALEQVKQLNQNSLTTKKAMKATKNAVKNPVAEKFVFMDKTVSILNVGFSTAKNVILYGPGE
jgi:ribosomal protein L23